jgi:hypothetical protein
MSIKSNGDFTTTELIETDNLVTNANYEFGDMTNFGSFTGWDATEQAWYKTSGSTGMFLSEYIPVQGNGQGSFDQYKIEAEFKQNTGTMSRYYFMIACYDKNKQFIDRREIYERYSGTRTTLASALNNGDTTITLTSSSNWTYVNDTTSHYSEQFAIFPDEHDYPDYTYSPITGRYVSVNTSTNVITLNTAWQGQNYPAGTAIMRTSDSGTYSYIGASNQLMTTDWVYRTGTSSAGENDGSMRYGSAYFRLGWLINRNAGTQTSYVRNIKVTNVTKGQVMSIGNNTTEFEEFDEVTGTTNSSVAQIKNGTLYITGEFEEV